MRRGRRTRTRTRRTRTSLAFWKVRYHHYVVTRIRINSQIDLLEVLGNPRLARFSGEGGLVHLVGVNRMGNGFRRCTMAVNELRGQVEL
jgi:hypothetical protein